MKNPALLLLPMLAPLLTLRNEERLSAAVEPEALILARAGHHGDIQAAVDPLHRKYADFLKSLRTLHAERNDTRAVLAIENELASLTHDSLLRPAATPGPEPPEDLANLRRIYARQLQNAVTPLQKEYLRHLETLLENIDPLSAASIEREIRRTRGQTSPFAKENSRMAIWNPNDD